MPPKASSSAPGPSSGKKQFKTSRFPAARIKKIMQMDEEVGKLASATPVMISKSLECFMQVLVDEVSKEAERRGTRKIVGYHFSEARAESRKHTINTNPNFDFLQDIVSRIPDPIETGGDEKPKTKRSGAAAGGDPGAGRKKKHTNGKGPGAGAGAGVPPSPASLPPPPASGAGSLPAIGTWKPDFSSAQGSGVGGRGMFDDYEEEEEDDDY